MLGILLLLLLQDSKPPATVQLHHIKVGDVSIARASGRLYKTDGEAHFEIENLSDKEIISIELQIDIIDSLRRMLKDRIFLTAKGRMFRRTIKAGQEGTLVADLRDYAFPSECVNLNLVAYDSKCIGDIKLNIVTFKDGTKWERPNWKTEVNPNQKPN